MIKWRGISFGLPDENGCAFTIRGFSTSRRDSRALNRLVSKDREVIAPLEDYFKIKQVIFNAPATIVLWADGTKTVVQCQNDEEFDEEKGLAMCFTKRALGNKGRYCETIKKWRAKSGTLIDVSAWDRAVEAVERAIGVIK